jgi:L-alanine-DL-glutamate epimerase-like enolase superfamily enzyme
VQLELVPHVLELRYAQPFKIARWDAELDTDTTVVVELRTADGRRGLGEAAADPFFGETPGTVQAVLPLLVDALKPLPAPPEDLGGARAWLQRASDALAAAIGHNGGAKCGVDCALHDLVAQQLGIPLYELVGGKALGEPTDFTLGIDTPEVVAANAAKHRDFPALKVKVGGADDVAALEAIREVYGGPLRVDANTGWSYEQALGLLPRLAELGVELVEQPLHPRHDDLLAPLQERSPIPIVVDESLGDGHDLERVRGIAGVNVKLTKCGGLGPATRLVARAKELGLRVLLGCTDVTSVGVAAAAPLASEVDWVDLDAPLLLAEEPFTPLHLDGEKRWRLAETPGLGVSFRDV